MRLLFIAVILATVGGCAGTNPRQVPAAPADVAIAPADHPARSWFRDTFRLGHLWGKKPPASKATPSAVILPPAGTTTTIRGEAELALPSGVTD